MAIRRIEVAPQVILAVNLCDETVSSYKLSAKGAAKWNEEEVSDMVVSFADRLLKGLSRN